MPLNKTSVVDTQRQDSIKSIDDSSSFNEISNQQSTFLLQNKLPAQEIQIHGMNSTSSGGVKVVH